MIGKFMHGGTEYPGQQGQRTPVTKIIGRWQFQVIYWAGILAWSLMLGFINDSGIESFLEFMGIVFVSALFGFVWAFAIYVVVRLWKGTGDPQ